MEHQTLPAIILVHGEFESSSEEFLKTDQSVLANEYCRTSTLDNIVEILHRTGFSSVYLRQVTLSNFETVLDTVQRQFQSASEYVVLNLCDGLETDGYPGLSVVQSLERRCIRYTGASSIFYSLTTSKLKMKECFQSFGVKSSPYIEVLLNDTEHIAPCSILIFWFLIVDYIFYGSF